MADQNLPILYVKQGCPWCRQAIEVLDSYGVEYRQQDVTRNEAAFEEMKQKSGQTKAPTLDWHGEILADFGPEELRPFLNKLNVEHRDS